MNYNGNSSHSAIAQFYACQDPKNQQKPYYISSDYQTKVITIGWSQPEDNGGCSVLGFKIFRTTGLLNNFDEETPYVQISTMSDSDPSLNQYQIDLSDQTVGRLFKFSILSYNYAGNSTSDSLYVKLASLPAQPDSSPTLEIENTNIYQLGVKIELFDLQEQTGGTPIIEYEIQYDEGYSDQYYSVYTLSETVILRKGIQRGKTYRVKYRAMNFNGWGNFSSILYVKASQRPSKPQKPDLIMANETHVQIQINPSIDDGADEIQSYKLFIDEIQEITNYTLISNDLTMQRTIEFSPPSTYNQTQISDWKLTQPGYIELLETGKVYRLITVSVNSMGESEQSQELRISLGRLPLQPNMVTKDENNSSETSIMLVWQQTQSIDDILIDGYNIYADNGSNGQFNQIYFGKGQPQITQFLVTELQTGLPYRFQLTALNINGESARSDIQTIYSCLKPSNLSIPEKISSTKSSILISWKEPSANGCPITGFTILINDGMGSEVNIVIDQSQVEQKPSLREYNITNLSPISSTFLIKIRAHNNAGSTDSKSLIFILAAVPDTPTDKVTSISELTSQNSITVQFGPLTQAQNGGSDILSYELQMDDGLGGNFDSLIGYHQDNLETKYQANNLTVGNIYRFIYRAKNINGWSQFSQIAYIQASNTPSRPPAPIILSISASNIEIQVLQSQTDRGNEIFEYKLFRNQGSGTYDFIEVDQQSYNFTRDAFLANIDTTNENLNQGEIYIFYTIAINQNGQSQESEYLYVGISDYPLPPATISKLDSESNQNYLTIQWDQSQDTQQQVLGYEIFIKEESQLSDEYISIFNSKNYPNILKFTISKPIIQQGYSYSIKIRALNFNGPGDNSTVENFVFCQQPQKLDAPYLVESSKTMVKLRWLGVTDDGGCPVLSYHIFMDNGDGGDVSEIDQQSINNIPTLREHIINFTSDQTSKVFKISLRASNKIGTINAEDIYVTLASVPEKPQNPPYLNYSENNIEGMQVFYEELPSSQDGGSQILSYEIQIYNYSESQWLSLAGGPNYFILSTKIHIISNVQYGESYLFRYRAWNVNGASEFSDTINLLCANVPSKPQKPIYISSNSSSVTLFLTPSFEDNGSMISQAQLSYSNYLLNDWTMHSDYDGNLIYTISTNSFILTKQIYKFRIRYSNQYGFSEWSNELILLIFNLPSKFDKITKNQSMSSKNSIMIQWTDPSSEQDLIIGYQIKQFNQQSNISQIIYDNQNNNMKKELLVENLETGISYSYQVKGYNLNGLGENWSDVATFETCVVPSGVQIPYVKQYSKQTIILEWKYVQDEGGCQILGFYLLVENKASSQLEVVQHSGSHVLSANIAVDQNYLGTMHKFQLIAYNSIGNSSSLVGQAIFAGPPQDPVNHPIKDLSFENSEGIKIYWNYVGDNGGISIREFQLEIDDGSGGDFIALTGENTNNQNYLQNYLIVPNLKIERTYRSRFKVRNDVGWSSYSPIGYIQAQKIPSPPNTPTLAQVTNSSFTIDINLSNNNFGDLITSYKIYKNQGNLDDDLDDLELEQNYDGVSPQYQFIGLQSGDIYKIYSACENDQGISNLSLPLIVGIGAPPILEGQLQHNQSFDNYDVDNNLVSIQVSWDQIQIYSALYINSFILYQDDGYGSDENFSIIFDSQYNPMIKNFQVTNLTAGLNYRFYIKAQDMNGQGQQSEILNVKACKLPIFEQAPTLISQSPNSVEIKWKQPQILGGCVILSYKVYLNLDLYDQNQQYSEYVNYVQPNINYYQINFVDDSNKGKHIGIKVALVNDIGESLSQQLAVEMAQPPAKPLVSPIIDLQLTNFNQIALNLTVVSDNGGSQILFYELQMDDGNQGEFQTIEQTSQNLSIIVQKDITRGKIYRFRYRAVNIIGKSEWSSITYQEAIQNPFKPVVPIYINGSDTEVCIEIVEIGENGGQEIEYYELEIDQGNNYSSSFSNIYQGKAQIICINQTQGLGTSNTKHRLRVRVKSLLNQYSQYSNYLFIAVGSLPSKPNAPTKNILNSTESSIFIQWDLLQSDSLPILGYQLYSDFGLDQKFDLIFDSTNAVTQNHYELKDVLNTVLLYKFYLVASNFNGFSLKSDIVLLNAGTIPSSGENNQFDAPSVTIIDQNVIEISWQRPTNDGGCPLQSYALFMDNSDELFVEIDSVTFRENVYFNTYQINMSNLSKIIGQRYQVKIAAINSQGQSFSKINHFLFVTKPSTPEKPRQISINSTYLEVQLQKPSSDGGDQVQSYNLQIKYTEFDSDWYDLIGQNTNNLEVTHYIRIPKLGQRIILRSRAKNSIGWSDFSEEAILNLIITPQKPPKPEFQESTISSVTVKLQQSLSDGGSPIISYQLIYQKLGDSDFTIDTNYDQSTIYEIVGLEQGQIYRISLQALNQVGLSDNSEILEAVPEQTAIKPSQIFKDETSSTKNSIYIYWNLIENVNTTILGYKLWMTNLNSEQFLMIYNGSRNSQQNWFNVTGLNTGQQYKFKLQSINFNGPSEFSETFNFYSCKIPYGQPQLYFITSSSTGMTLGWQKPIDDGGCAIQGFEILRNDGLNSIPNISVDENSLIRYDPTATQLTINSMPQSLKGQFIQFKILVYNAQGFVESIKDSSFQFSQVPDKPQNLQECNETNSTNICVEMFAQQDLVPQAISYHLEIDDGMSNNFKEIGQNHLTLKQVIQIAHKGLIYRLRYRIKNMIGYSEYSDIIQVLAADVPEAPPQPQFYSSTDSQITLIFQESQNDNGFEIQNYELYFAEGIQEIDENFIKIESYNGFDLTHTISVSEQNIQAGIIYTFKFAAKNVKGLSKLSDPLTAAISQPIGKPNIPTKQNEKIYFQSFNISQMQVKITWESSQDQQLPVKGYSLYLAEGITQNYEIIYDGNNNKNILQYVLNLKLGQFYRIKLSAFNFNQESELSDSLDFYACNNPEGLKQVKKISGTRESIQLSWEEPQYDGGCQILSYHLFFKQVMSQQVNEVDPSLINNNPSIRQYNVSLTSYTGQMLEFFYVVKNQDQEAQSPTTRFMIADKPSKPSISQLQIDQQIN